MPKVKREAEASAVVRAPLKSVANELSPALVAHEHYEPNIYSTTRMISSRLLKQRWS